MAEEGRGLSVQLSDAALKTLDQIWEWNAGQHGPEHADRYIQFLSGAVASLATRFSSGRQVPNRPALRYISIRRSRRGHGHVAVYRVSDDAVHVLDFFHTAQNWQDMVRRALPEE